MVPEPNPLDRIRFADEESIRAARAKLAQGNPKAIKRAVRILDSEKLEHTMTPEQQFEALKRLHPLRSPGEFPDLPEDCDRELTPHPDDFLALLKKSRDAVAPGPSQMTEELLYAGAFVNELVREKLALMTGDIRNGDVHEIAAVMLRRCRLIAGSKPPKEGSNEVGVRPLAVGEVLLKLAETLALGDCVGEMHGAFYPLQQGLAQAGCEHVAHNCQDALKKHPDWVVMTIDATNAYNTLCRIQAAKGLLSDVRFKPAWRVFHFAYAKEAELYANIGKKAFVVISSDGTRQGDVLGGFTFCHAIQPLLKDAAAKFPNVTIRAIIDDINIWGPMEDVLACYRFVVGEMAKLKLIANDKTTLYCGESQNAEIPDDIRKNITVTHSGVKIVGTMQSRDDGFISAWLERKLHKHDSLFRRLAMLPPNQAGPLLRLCGIPRMTYLLRTHETDLILPSARIFDGMVHEVIKMIACDAMTRVQEECTILLHLPGKHGGQGFTRTEWIQPHAYAAARSFALGGDAPLKQDTLVAELNTCLAKRVDSMGPIQKAHRLGCAKRNALRWSTSTNDTWTPAAYSAYFRWATVVYDTDIRIGAMHQCTGCNHLLTDREYHEHRAGCASLRGINASKVHNSVNLKGIGGCCARAGVMYDYEPELKGFVPPTKSDGARETRHKQHPDFNVHTEPVIVGDVKGINGACKSHCRSSRATIEKEKTDAADGLYGKLVREQGRAFIVPCFYTTGGMNKVFIALIQRLCDERPTTMSLKEEIRRMNLCIVKSVANLLVRHGGWRDPAIMPKSTPPPYSLPTPESTGGDGEDALDDTDDEALDADEPTMLPPTVEAAGPSQSELSLQLDGCDTRALNERLSNAVSRTHPNRAVQLTLMLAEQGEAEMAHMLDTPSALAERIDDALDILRKAGECLRGNAAVDTADNAAVDRAAADKAPVEKATADSAAIENPAAGKAAEEKAASDRASAENAAADKAAVDRAAADKAAVEKAAEAKAALEKAAVAGAERGAAWFAAWMADLEKAAADKAADGRAAANKAAVEKSAADRAAADKLAAEKAAADIAADEQAAADKAAADRAAANKAAVEKAATDRAAADKAEAEKADAGRTAADQAAADKDTADKATAETAAADKAMVEKAWEASWAAVENLSAWPVECAPDAARPTDEAADIAADEKAAADRAAAGTAAADKAFFMAWRAAYRLEEPTTSDDGGGNARLDLGDGPHSDNAARGELDGEDRHNATAATTVPGQAPCDDGNDRGSAMEYMEAQHKRLLHDPAAGPGLLRCDGYADRADHGLDDGDTWENACREDKARCSDNAARGELDGDDRHNATAATTVPGQAPSDEDGDASAALPSGGEERDSAAPLTTTITARGAAARSDAGEAKPTTPGGTKATTPGGTKAGPSVGDGV